MLTEWVTVATERLRAVPENVRGFFDIALQEAADKAAEATAKGKTRSSVLPVHFDVADADVVAFVAACEAGSRSTGLEGVSWKFRNQVIGEISYAVHVAEIGAVFAERWNDREEWRFHFEPGKKGDFWLDSYRDSMTSVELSYSVWGPAYAADKIAYSNKGVASVPTFQHGGRHYLITSIANFANSATKHGRAWRLSLPDLWHAETYSYETQGSAVEAGKIERGDRRGLIVSVRGVQYVLEAAIEVFDRNAAGVRLDIGDEDEDDAFSSDLADDGVAEDEDADHPEPLAA
ncbi:hypothetical protein [Burkholderia sp. Ac-20365]|uniref:hypothetical protein n=1 Tax=Burkholderia sp. Ac-20365 TaxID=2703897 RepID=UPI00197BE6EC|nr:hypothetical protein [Burkholderia sp. Ac-20365]